MIKVALELKAFQVGRVLHEMAIKALLCSDIFILNSLVHMVRWIWRMGDVCEKMWFLGIL